MEGYSIVSTFLTVIFLNTVLVECLVPPIIEASSMQLQIFAEGHTLTLECLATGDPPPMYQWTKNGRPLTPSSTVEVENDSGTLVLRSLTASDRGNYQCQAGNQGGVALSNITHVTNAIFEVFPSRKHDIYPHVGDGASLRADIPRSLPFPRMQWVNVDGESRQTVQLDARVSQDMFGNLYFAHVTAEDGQKGSYIFESYNYILNQTFSASPIGLYPVGDIATTHPPEFARMPHSYETALVGETWRAECIFSGNPTPVVTWTYERGALPEGVRIDSYGQEIVIDHVRLDHKGTYQCMGSNPVNINYRPARSISLDVEAAPYWKTPFESVDVAEGGNVTIVCDAGGIPAVNYHWFIDGIAVRDSAMYPPPDININRFNLYEVESQQTSVIQCNATNKYGYMFGNAYIKVISDDLL